ncbi:Crp/Fnr family transcriptional regulator [Aquisalinus flavus]|uniref:Transcriptional regulator n=1 Tax=Aquisalinus flavus TaxID=1526572 RepID=A0A8J2V6Y4_9PROT|nr:helix-turn-helix domain-containing protein [Aquisalinus flavus]MBD0426037.1 helix-turn-helix domain-containing protein [Aquisalinus flavus]UNE48372.1 cyclic nucleotide-binding domain-containing protein [Aquisalinus flavus]GGD11228.1 transcriptional regulator [Aquisalinus flavus]
MAALQARLPMRNPVPLQPAPTIETASVIRRVKAGETIYFEGDAATCCYRVVTGFAKEYSILEDGKRQVLDFYGIGEMFGISQSESHLHTAEAITDCTLRCFQRDAWLHAVTASPDLSQKFMNTLMTRLHRSRERLTMLGRMSATARMALFLMRLAEEQNSEQDVRFPMSRQDIGDHLGLTIETVCRILTDMKRRGIITGSTARLFSIPDMDALGLLAHGDASI